MGWIIFFAVGFLYYDLIAFDFMKRESNPSISKIPTDMLLLSLGLLIQAFAMSTIYQRMIGTGASLKSGFRFGAWIGILIGFGMGLTTFATAHTFSLNCHLVEAVWSIVFYGLVGTGIAWTQAKMN